MSAVSESAAAAAANKAFGREAALRDALAAAMAIFDDDARARALTALAPHLPEALREAALRDALAAAMAISGHNARAQALAALAPHLPEGPSVQKRTVRNENTDSLPSILTQKGQVRSGNATDCRSIACNHGVQYS